MLRVVVYASPMIDVYPPFRLDQDGLETPGGGTEGAGGVRAAEPVDAV